MSKPLLWHIKRVILEMENGDQKRRAILKRLQYTNVSQSFDPIDFMPDQYGETIESLFQKPVMTEITVKGMLKYKVE